MIDYALEVRTLSVILVRDQDGALRVATPDYSLAERSVGTKLVGQFERPHLRLLGDLPHGPVEVAAVEALTTA